MQPILAWLRYRPLSSSLRKLSTTSSCLASPTKALLGLGTLETPEQHKLAKEWVDNFRRDDIPKDAWEATYSRSSGPGGQNVNKTNSKATISCDIVAATKRWLPLFVLQPLLRSPYLVRNSTTLQISSQTSRSASDNLEAALSILHQAIVTAGGSMIVGPTSEEQKKRVQGLIKAENARRRTDKVQRGQKKASRRDFG